MTTHFPLEKRAERLVRDASQLANVSPSEIRLVHSPYRICPLGAHIDHQLGRVTGMALDLGILLAFAPSANGGMTIKSHDFDEMIGFGWENPNDMPRTGWGRYATGAVRALQAAGARLEHGITGVLEGTLPIGGLSSSAAVTIAYLLALESTNQSSRGPADNIRLEQYVEHVQIGLNNGILDQASILLSRRDQLLCLDCADESWSLIPQPVGAPEFGIVVAYSGLSASLASTGYNKRVMECEAAAALLLHRGGLPVSDTPRLRDVPREVYLEHGATLAPELERRARHFFSESARVQEGCQAWAAGDLRRFGELINESGRSSIENYECGCDELITLYNILSTTPGVYGARFSGGGFRGSCIALYEPGAEGAIRGAIEGGYPTKHPNVAKTYQIHFCASGDGATLV